MALSDAAVRCLKKANYTEFQLKPPMVNIRNKPQAFIYISIFLLRIMFAYFLVVLDRFFIFLLI